MKFLKIFMTLTIALAMMAFVPGCGDEDELTPDEEQTVPEEPEPEPEPEPDTDDDEYVDDGVLKILTIGNSFSRDAVEAHLWELFNEVGIESVIGNLYYSGCSLEQHYEFATKNSAEYSYRKVVDGVRTAVGGKTFFDVLLDEDWDYISFQQSSPLSGVYSTYKPFLPDLMEIVRENATNKHMEIIFHQTWAYSYEYSSSAYTQYYNADQMVMYYAIMDAVQQAVKDNNIEIVIPSGTAVQNARASYMGDTMNSDGRHLETTYGRFTAACTWFEKMSGVDVTTTSYAPEGVSDAIIDIVKNAVHFAVENPYEINPMDDWQHDPDITDGVSSTVSELSFTKAGGSRTISITASDRWTSTAPDWVTVEPESGSGGKDRSVKLTIASNTGEGSESRTGEVVFSLTSGEYDSATVTVSQAGSYSNEWFADDLDWLKPYAEAAGQVDCVGNGSQKGYVQTEARLDNVKVNGVSAMDELHSRGYLIERNDGVLSTSGSNVYSFAMPGYIYFGNSSTPIGLHLPSITGIPDDTHLVLSFDWCPGMNTGSGMAVDTVALQVDITNGSDVTTLTCPGHSFSSAYYEWLSVSLDLTEEGVTIDGDTDIFIHPQTQYWTGDTTRRRWFIDEISIHTATD